MIMKLERGLEGEVQIIFFDAFGSRYVYVGDCQNSSISSISDPLFCSIAPHIMSNCSIQVWFGNWGFGFCSLHIS